jgi:hypothetical protein
MAVSGSIAMVNYGAYVEISIGGSFSVRHYADVQKCQKVDMILGIPFMSKYNVGTRFGDARSFEIGTHKFLAKIGARVPSESSQGKRNETISEKKGHVSFQKRRLSSSKPQ